MSRRRLAGLVCALTVLVPAVCLAQSDQSRLWLVAGAASATTRGDCQTCEEEYPYRNGAGVLVNAGYRANARMDVGAEIFWVPMDSESGQIRSTHFDAVAQFRPWHTRGFFLKGGAGMALVRNWVDTLGPEAINSKALSIVIGGGWVFRPQKRVGLELFLSQHAAALGDFRTGETDVPDVIGNYWSVGVALVFR